MHALPDGKIGLYETPGVCERFADFSRNAGLISGLILFARNPQEFENNRTEETVSFEKKKKKKKNEKKWGNQGIRDRSQIDLFLPFAYAFWKRQFSVRLERERGGLRDYEERFERLEEEERKTERRSTFLGKFNSNGGKEARRDTRLTVE